MPSQTSDRNRKAAVIRVFEDESDYLVQIPVDLRDRAKAMPGRRWDPERRLWVIPKSEQAYRRLSDEFSGDADQFSLTASLEPKTVPPPNENSKEPQVETRILEEFTSRATVLEENWNNVSELITRQSAELTSLMDRLGQLDFKSIKDESSKKLDATRMDRVIRLLLRDVADGNEDFIATFGDFSFVRQHLHILNRMEEETKRQLRSFLQIDHQSILSLSDLIKEGEETGAFDKSTKGLLTHFRVMRNEAVHESGTITRTFGTCLSAMLSLALAWRSITIKTARQ